MIAIGQNAGLDHLVVLPHREFFTQDLDCHREITLLYFFLE
jgi:hypothetical protein